MVMHARESERQEPTLFLPLHLSFLKRPFSWQHISLFFGPIFAKSEEEQKKERRAEDVRKENDVSA